MEKFFRSTVEEVPIRAQRHLRNLSLLEELWQTPIMNKHE
jgi:hypothetical protein